MEKLGAELAKTWLPLLAMILIILLIALLGFFFREQIQGLGHFGYVGVVLLGAISSATVILPAPFLPIVFSLGSVLNPWLLGIFAAVGSMIGETTGYFAGWSGKAVIENSSQYARIKSWMTGRRRIALLTLFVLAIFPLPLFDIAGILAGVLRFPVWQFWLASFPGKIIKMTLVAMAGYYSIDWLYRIFSPI
ncbi:MAG TPA: VTT domain-containing protein [Anaerolineales bacterium]|nr:VTT domain-containing protein [Anaerolineales bacterium]